MWLSWWHQASEFSSKGDSLCSQGWNPPSDPKSGSWFPLEGRKEGNKEGRERSGQSRWCLLLVRVRAQGSLFYYSQFRSFQCISEFYKRVHSNSRQDAWRTHGNPQVQQFSHTIPSLSHWCSRNCVQTRLMALIFNLLYIKLLTLQSLARDQIPFKRANMVSGNWDETDNNRCVLSRTLLKKVPQ